jgi:hypothetical protein
MEANVQHHTAAALLPWKNPGSHWAGGWVDSAADLDILGREKSLVPAGIWTPDCAICSLVATLTTLSIYGYACMTRT